jgi:cell division protein FtsB
MDVSDRLGIRAQWSDGKKQRVENCLNSFIAGLVTASHAIKKHREDEARREREREEQQRRYAQAQRSRWEEEQRVEKLDQQMSNWKRAQGVRAYAQAIEEFAVRNYGKLDLESELGKWVSWIRRYADKIDPITPCQDEDD